MNIKYQKMKQLTSLKTLILFLSIMFSCKISFSQVRSEKEIPSNLKLPDNYYKGIEEKRKYAESQKASSVKTTTATSFYPSPQPVKKETGNPELRAKALLNTANIPSGFPLYNSNSMTAKEYEEAVVIWFKKNPSYRKTK